MRFAPIAWNYLTSGTVSTAAAAFERGCPAANLTDADLSKIARWRGWYTVDATNNKIDGNDGAGFVATLNSATYYSPQEMAVEVARALNAASTNWRCYWRQGSTDRFRFVITRTSGTGSFQVSTGANAAVNAMRYLLGFRTADRAAAATHTGDYAAPSGSSELVTYDLGSNKVAGGSFLFGLRASPGVVVSVATGTTTALATRTFQSGDAYDDDTMFIPYATTDAIRYVELRLNDTRREEFARTSLAYWYHGPVLDTDRSGEADRREQDWAGYERKLVQRSRFITGRVGQEHADEVLPGEEVTVTFRGGGGLGPSGGPVVLDLVAALGVEDLAFIALDPTDEPHRESMLARVTQASLERAAVQSRAGRWPVAVTFERVVI